MLDSEDMGIVETGFASFRLYDGKSEACSETLDDTKVLLYGSIDARDKDECYHAAGIQVDTMHMKSWQDSDHDFYTCEFLLEERYGFDQTGVQVPIQTLESGSSSEVAYDDDLNMEINNIFLMHAKACDVSAERYLKEGDMDKDLLEKEGFPIHNSADSFYEPTSDTQVSFVQQECNSHEPWIEHEDSGL